MPPATTAPRGGIRPPDQGTLTGVLPAESTPGREQWAAERAHQLTDQLLRAIRAHRARVVVIDITGVPDVDESVADDLVKTVDASRLMAPV